MVQSPRQPAMWWVKLRSSAAPCGRVHDLGMEHARRRSGAASSAMAAKGAPSLTPTTRKPGGSASTRSPWLIHTCSRAPLAPQPVEQRAVVGDVDEGAAEFAVVARLDRAAQLGAHGLLAIADAQHRHAQLEHRLRRARRAASRSPRPGRPTG